jgi:type I restriction enzyme S subunit
MNTKLKQKQIPKDWRKVRLGDIGSATIGLTYSPSDVVEQGGTPVLRSSNIQNNVVDYADLVRVTTPIPEKLRTREGDILICARNGSRNLIGKSAYITDADAGNTFGAFMSIFRTKHHRYAFQLFQSKAFKREIARDLGPTINQVTTGNLHKFKFNFPPEDEEDRIVKVLEAWDRAIELVERKIALKREVKKGLMQRLLTGKVRLPGFSGEWKYTKLEEVVQLIPSGVYGDEQQTDGAVPMPVATTAQINSDDTWNNKQMTIRYFREKQVDEYSPKLGDILVVKSSGSASNIKSGKLGFVDEDRANTFVFSNFLMLLRATKIDPRLLYYYLTSHEVKKRLPSLCESSTYPNIIISEYMDIKVPDLSDSEQKSIVDVLRAQEKTIDLLQQKLTLLKDQKKYLLNNLVTGAIRTPAQLNDFK